jgi:hypothetical protein
MDCKITSTGYDITIPIEVRENVKAFANRVFPDINYIMYDSYRAIIMYSDTFKIGYDISCLGNIVTLKNWFGKHKCESYGLIISGLYITRNTIIGDGYIGWEKVCIFFTNMNASSALTLKKSVLTGVYGPPHILSPCINLSAKTYIYLPNEEVN